MSFGEILRIRKESSPSKVAASRLSVPFATFFLIFVTALRAYGSADSSLLAAREASLNRHYSRAVRILRDATKKYPEDTRLKIELGRAYLYSGDLARAEKVLRPLVATDPSNRNAKLELAHVLRHRKKYAESDAIYRQLQGDPSDEPAAIGLASNLIHEKRTAEARAVLDSALARHPNSLRLQEYADRLEKGQMNQAEIDEEEGLSEVAGASLRMETVEASAEYVSDSAGNQVMNSIEAFRAQLMPGVKMQLRTEQHSFRGPDETSQFVLMAGDELQVEINGWASLVAEGGAVRFDGGSLSGVYRAGFEVRPARTLLAAAQFERNPVYADGQAVAFRIMQKGVETRLAWHPAQWEWNAYWTRQHYSDGNWGTRGSGEIIRKFGGQTLLFETGYRLTAYSFQTDLLHGYFAPDLYRSHLGVLGFQLRPAKHFRAECLGRLGAESISQSAPFHTAWEASLVGELLLRHWQISSRYAYYHLVQSSGAFRANVGTISIRYRF